MRLGFFGGRLGGFSLTACVLLFTQTAFFGGFGFLAAQQLGVAARFFLAAGSFSRANHWRRRSRGRSRGRSGSLGSGGGRRCLGRRGRLVIAFDEGAFFAHFHLNGAGFAGGVSLLDFAGGFLGQRDFLAGGRDGAVAALQMVQQLFLVRFGQDVAARGFFDSGRLQLLQQLAHGAFEFIRQFSDCDVRHIL